MAAGIMKKSKPSQVDKSDRTARPWKWLLVASVVIALLMLFFSIGFSEPKSSKKMRPQTVLVVTVTARQGDLNVYINALGSILPLQTVRVKSRIDGQIMKMHFQEG